MSRRPLDFSCHGERLFATLDEARGTAGLLLVSGGNEIRSGAWSGQAQLAARLAAAGWPVLRFDRRGVGDSEGANRGFRGSRPDLAAALGAFREACPQLRRIVGFGNCDAASALALFGGELDLDGLLLANPWVVEGNGNDLQGPASLRRRYREKLADPAAWSRLLSGKVNLGRLAAGVRMAAAPGFRSPLAEAMRAGLDAFPGPVRILLAERDRTAQLFLEAWDPRDRRIARCPSASHGFADAPARAWLLEHVLAALPG